MRIQKNLVEEQIKTEGGGGTTPPSVNKYSVDTNNSELVSITNAKDQALADVDNQYLGTVNPQTGNREGGIIADTESAYEKAQEGLLIADDGKTSEVEAIIDANNASTEVTVQGLQNQIGESEESMKKEQSAAYADFQKQINPFGANAESIAAAGLGGTGYSESSKVAMYNQYQNRVATAREVHNKNVVAFNQAIAEARAQNNLANAQIAFDAFTKRSEIMIEGLLTKNSLLDALADRKRTIENDHIANYNTVYNRLQEDERMKFEMDKYNDSVAKEKLQNYRNEALFWFEQGKMPSEDLLEKTGWNAEEIAHLKDSYVMDAGYVDEEGNSTSAPTDWNMKVVYENFGNTISDENIQNLETDKVISSYVENGVGQFKINYDGFKKVPGREGGDNYFGGVNGDAWIEAPDGKTYPSDVYVNFLQSEYGISKAAAKNFVINIQKHLGLNDTFSAETKAFGKKVEKAVGDAWNTVKGWFK
jgi:hypothetical protein